MAKLSTHVLDTSTGHPAGNLTIDLHLCDGTSRHHIKTVTTNHDGRTDEPILTGDHLESGIYELTFHAAAYLGATPFYDLITIRFAIHDPHANYHIPLLLSPYGYTTYRGS